MRIAVFLFLALLSTSCKRPTLAVESGYFTRKDLASYQVGTPDPNKLNPIFGQRLYITWNVTPQEFAQGPLELHIMANLKKEGTLDKKVPLDRASGSYTFSIAGDDYTKKGGLLSYKVTLLSDNKEIALSRHKFWVEELKFSE